MKKKVSVLICLLCVVFLVLGLAACNEEHKHTTCEICGLCTDASCTGSASEKCQGHNTDGEDTIIKDGLTYQLNDADGVATIIAADSSFNGDIPSKITRSSQGKEYSVTRIEAKIGNSTIRAISIPDSVTFIATDAFEDCSGLTSATIPTLAIDYIPKNNLETIVITSGNSINAGAFSDCSSLTSITLPFVGATKDGTDNTHFGYIFGASSYSDNSTSVPASLKTVIITGGSSIGYNAFKGCSSLTSITLPFVGATKDGTDNTHFGYIFGASKFEDNGLYVPDSLKTVIITGGSSIGEFAFAACSGLTSITIPDSVTSIGEGAFEDCSGLTSATIPTLAIDYIPKNNLETIVITSGSSINAGAFSDCSSLTSITLPFVGATKDGTDNTHFGYIFGASIFEDNGLYVPDSLKTVIITGGSSIGEFAFAACSGLTSITIPDSVTSIGEGAFSYGISLTSITIPDSVTSIGGGAFYDCSGLTSITLPGSVTSIGGDAFSGTAWYNNQLDGLVYAGKVAYKYKGTMPSNTEIIIKEGTLEITAYAFEDCSGLTSITIPDSVTSIGEYAFSGTAWYNNQPDGLVYAGKVAYKYKGTMPSNTEITIKEGTLGIGLSAFSGYSSLTSITIPDSVTSIGDRAFYYCSSLTSITIPDSVISIGGGAFYYCSSLTSITIPDGVTSIGEDAFSGCSSLTSVIVEEGNTKYHSVDNCIIETETKTLIVGCKSSIIPADGSVTSIGESAFRDCSSLTSITIPDSVISIRDWAFSGCRSLTSITIPDGVISIGNRAFQYCNSLTNVTIGKGVTSIGEDAFSGCSSLTSITIPDSVTSIGRNAFSGCSSLTSITIPDSVTSIEDNSFRGCSSLTSITIPDSVTSIGGDAFSGTAWYNNQLDGLVYAGKVAYKYKGTMPSNTEITIKEGTLGIGSSVFYGCSGLTSIIIPDSVTSIGHSAFSDCSSLTSIIIPDNVISIGYCAFSGCSSLTSIIIPDNVISIGNRAFQYCNSLTNVTIGKGVTSIGYSAFEGCSSLTSITIPDSVTSIGGGAFGDCSSLASVIVEEGNTKYHDVDNCIIETETKTLIVGCKSSIIPADGSVTSIGEDAFRNCSSLTSITIPDSVTSIENSSFYGCSGLTSITIPDSVTFIGLYAFEYCRLLTSIQFSGTKSQWNAIYKGYNWNSGTGNYTITCSDGVINK